MKKATKKLWGWILTGLVLAFGISSCIHIPTPKVYGPIPEVLYGPPTPELEVDTVNEILEEEAD